MLFWEKVMPGAIATFLRFEDQSQHTEHIAQRQKESRLLKTSLTAALSPWVYEKPNMLVANDL